MSLNTHYIKKNIITVKWSRCSRKLFPFIPISQTLTFHRRTFTKVHTSSFFEKLRDPWNIPLTLSLECTACPYNFSLGTRNKLRCGKVAGIVALYWMQSRKRVSWITGCIIASWDSKVCQAILRLFKRNKFVRFPLQIFYNVRDFLTEIAFQFIFWNCNILPFYYYYSI